LIEDLGPGPAGVDTAAFIYLIEEHPRFLPIVLPLFAEVDAGRRVIATSAITLLEVLVTPLRARNTALAAKYEALLTRSRGVRLVDVTREQLKDAAALRASAAVRTPDALQLAAARAAGCGTFVTNDRALPAVCGLRILQLSDYA